MPEKGWYADPADASRRRYWDGTRWTSSTGANPARPPELGSTATQTAVSERSTDPSPPARTPADTSPPNRPFPFATGPSRRLVLYGAAAAVLLVIIVVAVVVLRGGGDASPIKPVPNASQAYLNAVHTDIPKDTTPNATLLRYGQLVCDTYGSNASPTQRLQAVDRPDLIPDSNTRGLLLGEALNHLCPQYQLRGIKPVPPSGPTTTAPTTTVPSGPSISVGP